MILKIGNKRFERFNNLNVSYRYDGVASTFSFSLYFNPNDPEHRQLFKPGQYNDCTVEYRNRKLITGTLLSPVFSSSSVAQLVNVSGYSKTGVLEDCTTPPSAYPLQSIRLNLKEITEKIISKFKLKVIIDSNISKKANQNFKDSTGGETQTVKSYLTDLANQKHIIVTHDTEGNLVYTEADTKQAAKFHFDGSRPAISMDLKIDGQKMHSDIRVQRDHIKGSNSAGKAEVKNPYVAAYRPLVMKISTGNDTSPEQAARNKLSEELKAIALIIEIEGWEIDGELVTPNIIITAENPECYLYSPTNFFVEQVDYVANSEKKTATLTCYLPEVYNSDPVKNIFES